MKSKDGNLLLPYVNYKGSYAIREIYPIKVVDEVNNPYHGDGFILKGVCCKKNEFRDFSFEGLTKGVIHSTLRTLGETSSPEKVEGIYKKIYEEAL